MRKALIVAALAALALPGEAFGGERGQVIRAADLMAQPFIDAAKTGPVAANQPVTILSRKGAWANVEAAGRNGWVRMLNLRLEGPGGVPQAAAGQGGKGPSANAFSSPASLLRTNSSGRTVTTGVKGLDEENIRNAVPDPAQLAKLDTLAVAEAEARSNAASSKLVETQLDYLKAKGK